LIWLLLLAASLYAFYKFVPPEVTFYMLKTEVEDEANIAHMYGDAALTRRILEKADIWHAPIERGDIEITRGHSKITISISYSVTLSFLTNGTGSSTTAYSSKGPLKSKADDGTAAKKHGHLKIG